MRAARYPAKLGRTEEVTAVPADGHGDVVAARWFDSAGSPCLVLDPDPRIWLDVVAINPQCCGSHSTIFLR